MLLLGMLCCVPSQAREFPRHEQHDWSHLSLEDMSGNFVIPVIFVGFEQKNGDNETTVSKDNQESWMKRLNDVCNANHMGADGSVSDYFLAQSYGKTHVSFEAIGEYVATGKAADYAETSQSRQLVRKAAQAMTDADWSRYDKNGDGEVDCLLLIYAGHCDGNFTQSGIEVKSIYPHRSWQSFAGSRAKVANHYVESYVFMNDLRDNTNHVAAIHTACHELGHGIFDLNDYYYDLKSYLGQYDLMCYGFRQTNYSAADNHSCDMTAFNRMYLGWLTPKELTTSGHYTLQPLSKEADAYIISDPANANHFFLLENRARISKSWDAHLPASGLILTEVHYSRATFNSHTVNHGKTPNIQVIDANTGKGLKIPNETYLSTSQKAVPYGTNGHTEITPEVSPLFETMRVRNITVNADKTVSFDFEMLTDAIGQTPFPTPADAPLYDLQGRRVTRQLPGTLYIKGGKKIVVR